MTEVEVDQKSIEAIRATLEQQQMDWSRQVKTKDGWVCQDCGELDQELLEAHHIKPKAMFPDDALKVANGTCVCIPCHAKRHKANLWVYNLIMVRLAKVLYRRLYPGKEI